MKSIQIIASAIALGTICFGHVEMIWAESISNSVGENINIAFPEQVKYNPTVAHPLPKFTGKIFFPVTSLRFRGGLGRGSDVSQQNEKDYNTQHNYSKHFVEHSGDGLSSSFLLQLAGASLTLVMMFKLYRSTRKQKPTNHHLAVEKSTPVSVPVPPSISNFNSSLAQQKIQDNSAIKKAHICFEQGDIEGAIANFNRAISNNPNNAEIYSQRANFLNNKLKDKQGAIEDYNQAIKINPDNAYFYFWRSKAYQDLGNKRQAIEDYNTAMRLTVDNNLCYQLSNSGKIITR